MEKYFIIFAIIMFFVTLGNNSKKRSKNEEGKNLKGIELCSYIGGSTKINNNKPISCSLYIYDNKITFDLGLKGDLNIYIKDISSVDYKTELDIQNDISLGRLVVFGALALGMKEEKKKVRNYFIITHNNEVGYEEKILFESKNAGRIVNKIFEMKKCIV